MAGKYSLYKRKLRKGPIWYFRVSGELGRPWHSTGTARKDEAEAFVEKWLRDEPLPNTLAEFASDFFIWAACTWIKLQHEKGKRFSRSVALSRRSHLENYIFPQFGHRLVDSIRAAEVEDWLVNLALSNQTRNHLLFTFRIVLREAVRQNRIYANPLESVKQFAPQPRERDVFSVDELSAMFPAQLDDRDRIWGHRMWATFFYVLATTGMRAGEARALRWVDIDLDVGGVLVRRGVQPDGTISTPKSGEGRAVLLARRTAEALAGWREQSPLSADDDLVFFSSATLGVIARETVSRQLGPAVERAGIERDGRNLVVHSFRHGYNTLARRTMPDRVLRKVIGHRSERMTQLYDHSELADELRLLEESRDQIEAAVAGRLP